MKRLSLDARIGWALFAFAFFALLFTEQPAGFVRDESVYFAAAESHARWFQLLFTSPSEAFGDAAIVRFFDFNHEHPALMKNLFGLSFVLFHEKLGLLRPAAAFRLPAFVFAALILPLTYALARRFVGRAAAAFAALVFLLVPRQFFEAHLACFDVPVTTMWLAVVWAFWRAQEASDEDPKQSRWWVWAGVLCGLAFATKHNTLFLPILLTPFALWRAWVRSGGSVEGRRLGFEVAGVFAAGAALYLVLAFVLGPDRFQRGFLVLSPQLGLFVGMAGVGGWRLWRLAQVHRPTFHALAPLVTMAVLGPVVFYLHWPYLWHAPVDRTAWYLAFHATHNHYAWFYLGEVLRAPPFPLFYVVVKTALTVPTSLFVAMCLGLAGSLWAIVRFKSSFLELLVVANALASIIIISAPNVPHFGGVKHWFPSMPFLAVLAAVSLERSAAALWPWLKAKRPTLPEWAPAVALAVLLALPALIGSVRVYPWGTSHYSELAGGLPGAASLGMQRQFWANNATGVFAWLNANARPGERVYLHENHGGQIRDYQRNGMLRKDLGFAGSPFDADIVAYQYHQEFREHEFNTWEAFGTTKPVAGLYVDETPQVVVYRRQR